MPPAGGSELETSETRLHRPWALFFAWLIVGGLFSLGAISIASIGLFVLPAALVATVAVVRQPATWRGVSGLLAGLGMPALFVAYLNRGGPASGGCVAINGGQLCASTGGSGSPQTVSQLLNPWPWLAVGVLLIAIGIGVFVLTPRSRRT
jgi:hypothetical protein